MYMTGSDLLSFGFVQAVVRVVVAARPHCFGVIERSPGSRAAMGECANGKVSKTEPWIRGCLWKASIEKARAVRRRQVSKKRDCFGAMASIDKDKADEADQGDWGTEVCPR